MTAMSTPNLPRIYVQDLESANEEIVNYLEALEADGERPWCEVFYPAPVELSPEQAEAWYAKQAETFDAVELVNGKLETLPPYADLFPEGD